MLVGLQVAACFLYNMGIELWDDRFQFLAV